VINTRELLKGEHQRGSDVVAASAGLAVPNQVHIQDSIRKIDPAITDEAVPDSR
jgi:hypothetical protein